MTVSPDQELHARSPQVPPLALRIESLRSRLLTVIAPPGDPEFSHRASRQLDQLAGDEALLRALEGGDAALVYRRWRRYDVLSSHSRRNLAGLRADMAAMVSWMWRSRASLLSAGEADQPWTGNPFLGAQLGRNLPGRLHWELGEPLSAEGSLSPLRRPLLRAKMQILRALSRGFASEFGGPWAVMCRAIERRFTAAERGALLGVDSALRREDLSSAVTFLGQEADPMGSLLGLVNVIGSYEALLSIPPLDAALPEFDGLGLRTDRATYFDCMRSARAKDLNALLDSLVNLDEALAGFWQHVADRTNAWIQGVQEEVDGLHARHAIRKQRSIAAAESDSERVTASFRHMGAAWYATFRGKAYALPDLVGMSIIHHLLGQPGTRVEITELVRAIARPAGERRGSGSATDEGATFRGNALGLRSMDTELDPEALRNISSELKRLQQELASLPVDGSPSQERRRAELQAEIAGIQKQQGKSITPRGRVRPLDKARKNAVDRIRKSLGEALVAIKSDAPALGAHLEACIQGGAGWVYSPTPPVIWLLR